jgi:hypothetical protein
MTQSIASDNPVFPRYNPGGRAVEIFDASFSPISVSMVAHYVWINTEGDTPKPEHTTMPVIGVLVRHHVDAHGEITDVETVLAVQYEDGCQSIVPAMSVATEATNMGFVGCYLENFPPTDEELNRVAVSTWNWMQHLAAKAGA